MNVGPNTMRKRPAISVSDRATFDHFRNISLSSSDFPSVASFVAIGETTAAMAITKSIR